MVRALHTSVPGRGRFRVSGLHRSAALKECLETGIPGNGFIRQVSADILTGNVLVRFDQAKSHELICSLLELKVAEFLDGQKGAGRPFSALPPLEECETPPAQANPGKFTNPPLAAKLSGFFAAAETQREEPWHCLEPDAVLATFDSNREVGLTSDQAREHLRKFGSNLLPESTPKSRFSILVDQFKSFPVYLLGAAAGVSVLTGGLADAVVILTVVAVNGVIGYVTESESEKTIQSLKSLVRPSAEVIRDSAAIRISGQELVPGDLLVLKPGTSVGADCRLIDASHLSLDESVLTGESMPVVKNPDVLNRPDIPLADRVNMLYMGTLVTGGHGMAVVVATGRYTEVGRLQMLVGEAESPETPMERQLTKLG
ncbi:MAG: ATPase, partial [Syntrophobacteraceae bacterium]|nr:ATPase [Syntrophobacteraceae bacterium]